IQPDKITLSGRSTWQRFLVVGYYADGRVADLTASSKATKSGSAGVRVEGNRVMATANGEAQVVAAVGGLTAAMKVTVQDINPNAEWSFANEIVPIFTKAGCNGGG